MRFAEVTHLKSKREHPQTTGEVEKRTLIKADANGKENSV